MGRALMTDGSPGNNQRNATGHTLNALVMINGRANARGQWEQLESAIRGASNGKYQTDIKWRNPYFGICIAHVISARRIQYKGSLIKIGLPAIGGREAPETCENTR